MRPKRSVHVLVVDDDLATGDAIAEALGEEGYQVITVSSGNEALRVVKGLPLPRAAVIDLRMPAMDGQALVGALRADPSLKDLLIIAMTAGQPTEVRGADRFLRKPFELPALVGLLEVDLAGGDRPRPTPW
jgi:CheY-like chemotaxis protein